MRNGRTGAHCAYRSRHSAIPLHHVCCNLRSGKALLGVPKKTGGYDQKQVERAALGQSMPSQKQMALQYKLSAICENDDKIHHDHHEIVMPTGCALAPKACVPNKNLLCYCSEHDQNQSHGSDLRQHTKRDADTSSQLGGPQEDCKSLAHTDVFASAYGVLKMIPPARCKNHRDHQP